MTQDMDLVIFSLTGNFNLNKLLDAAMAGTIFSASFEIVDLRRCNLNTMRSMDLAPICPLPAVRNERGPSHSGENRHPYQW